MSPLFDSTFQYFPMLKLNIISFKVMVLSQNFSQNFNRKSFAVNVNISFKGAVVTTKPRRSRRGRGAAAIIK